MAQFITKYSISADRLKVKAANGVISPIDLYATLLSPEPDSPAIRTAILDRVLGQIEGEVLKPTQIKVEPTGVVRADINVFRESFSLSPSISDRARVIVRLPCPTADFTAYDRWVDLEEALDRQLQEQGVGFADGHDVGQGEFCIYCHGPKKKPLREAVARFLGQRPHSGAQIR